LIFPSPPSRFSFICPRRHCSFTTPPLSYVQPNYVLFPVAPFNFWRFRPADFVLVVCFSKPSHPPFFQGSLPSQDGFERRLFLSFVPSTFDFPISPDNRFGFFVYPKPTSSIVSGSRVLPSCNTSFSSFFPFDSFALWFFLIFPPPSGQSSPPLPPP